MKFSNLNHRNSRVFLRISGALAAIGLSVVAVAQEEDRVLATNPVFDGPVYQLKTNSTGGFAHVYFPPGSRTKWHVHEGGQVVLCEEGTCINAIKGGPTIRMKAGEASYAPPGVAHWQGSAPDAGGTQFNGTRGKLTILESVTEEEYHAPASHLSIVGPGK